MSSLLRSALGTMINGTAGATGLAQTGATTEVVEDLEGEKTSKALNLVFHKIVFQPLTLQVHLIKAKGPQQPTMTMTENVKLFRTTWRSGRAQDNGAFPRIPLLRIHYLDLQISLQKS